MRHLRLRAIGIFSVERHIRYSADIPQMQVIVTDHVELLDDWFRTAIIQRCRDGRLCISLSTEAEPSGFRQDDCSYALCAR
jgi:hypothetical protein